MFERLEVSESEVHKNEEVVGWMGIDKVEVDLNHLSRPPDPELQVLLGVGASRVTQARGEGVHHVSPETDPWLPKQNR